MKCDSCNDSIEKCDSCGVEFEIGEEIYCSIKSHYCSESCLFDTFEIEETEVIK